jgi:hypothetical protein
MHEPSVVAVRKDARSGRRILVIGAEAKNMLGRTPGLIARSVRSRGFCSKLPSSPLGRPNHGAHIHRRHPRVVDESTVRTRGLDLEIVIDEYDCPLTPKRVGWALDQIGRRRYIKSLQVGPNSVLMAMFDDDSELDLILGPLMIPALALHLAPMNRPALDHLVFGAESAALPLPRTPRTLVC